MCSSDLRSRQVAQPTKSRGLKPGDTGSLRCSVHHGESESTAKCVREWLGRVGVKTQYTEPFSPWGNGYVESFNGQLRDDLLERKSFDTLLEAKALGERWRQDYNTIRPHSALGYRSPAPESRRA